jgi:hypothetical protein
MISTAKQPLCEFDDIFEVINYLLKKDSLEKQTKDRNKIGYKVVGK